MTDRPVPANKRELQRGDYARIKRMSSKGWRQTDICLALNMDFRTWKRLLQDDPEAKAAYDSGLGAEHQALVGKLFDTAVNAKGREAVTAAIFLLKARPGYREGEPLEAIQTPTVSIVNLPAPLTPEQYERIYTAAPKEVVATAAKKENDS